jgi:hypothetical protein
VNFTLVDVIEFGVPAAFLLIWLVGGPVMGQILGHLFGQF